MMLPKSLFISLLSTAAFADIVSISPTSINFGDQVVGVLSLQTITLSNPTKKVLNISSITTPNSFFVFTGAIGGGTSATVHLVSGGLAVSGLPCGGVVAPGTQCVFFVVFATQSLGLSTGVLSVNDDANNTPQKVKLSGTGVPVALQSIGISPATATVPQGLAQQFTATGIYNNGAVQDLTNAATWSSASPSIATIAPTGLASTFAQGTAAITASLGTVSGSATLTVGPPVLVSMFISPASGTVKKGASLQLAATGVYSDHSTTNLTAASQWTSLSQSIATVSSAGRVSGVTPGTATIQAATANLSATSTITVPPPVIVSGLIVPPSFFIPIGTSQPFSCRVTYDDGSTSDFTSPLMVWTSSLAPVCSIDPTSGLATCNGIGTVTITANLCGRTSARLDSPVTGPRNNMSSPHSLHTATRLADGRVLIAGGVADSTLTTIVAAADLYDPTTQMFSAASSMASPRAYHTATLLLDGRVLIAGGSSGSADLSSAELYDPATGLFTLTGSLNVARGGHTATLLPNGTVLIAGGDALPGELYDPIAGTFTPIGSLSVQRFKGTATLLANGKVLFTGGRGGAYVATAELFDPSTAAFSPAGSMGAVRAYHTAVPLNDGTVFIAGGFSGTATLSSTEIYNPSSGVFTPAGPMSTARDTHAATVLPSGKVLISGGENQTGTLTNGEIFDPAFGAIVMPGILGMSHYPGPGFAHTATLLTNGQVLIAGGVAASAALASAELFAPQQ
jgi:hypothetical protein